MKRWSVPLLVMFVMICLISDSLLSAPQSESSQANVNALLKRIDQLEKRVEQLEESRTLTVMPTQSPAQRPGLPHRSVPPASTIPDNWKEKQINGLKYYIVPLELSKDRKNLNGTDPHRNQTTR